MANSLPRKDLAKRPTGASDRPYTNSKINSVTIKIWRNRNVLASKDRIMARKRKDIIEKNIESTTVITSRRHIALKLFIITSLDRA